MLMRYIHHIARCAGETNPLMFCFPPQEMECLARCCIRVTSLEVAIASEGAFNDVSTPIGGNSTGACSTYLPHIHSQAIFLKILFFEFFA